MTHSGRSMVDWADKLFAMTPEADWSLRESGYDPLLEREVESRLSVGNGLIGIRGSCETPAPASRPRTYVAGLFDEPPGATGGPTLVPAPDWMRLILTVNGQEVDLLEGDGQTRLRTLNMLDGTVVGDWVYRLPSDAPLQVRTLRLASLDDPRVAMQVVRIQAEEEADLDLEARLVPMSLGLSYDGNKGPVSLWHTAGTGYGLSTLAKSTMYRDDGSTMSPKEEEGGFVRRWVWKCAPGKSSTLVRTVTMQRYDDVQQRDASAAILAARPTDESPADILAAHQRAWAERWNACDVRIEGDEEAQEALRFTGYQLSSAANPRDERVSIGARGLTGDAYGGHVFWDTEIFLLPFFTFTWPEAARALLMYRYHTLSAARAKADRLGYKGALYAWESADTGAETTPKEARLPNGEVAPILCGLLEHHISADIAFAVWLYWRATGDEQFLLDGGAEILLETARFWASRVALEADGRYHIRNVIGPDEYHEGVDDNAFTNVMAQWNLEKALAAAQHIESVRPGRWNELCEALDLGRGELGLWADVAARMYTGFHADNGLYEQFAGFFGLENVDLSAYEPRSAAMDMILGRDRTRASQVIKQADVVMLMALLWDHFPADVRSKNFHYYERRCGHGSSLSPPIHALVAARLGELQMAEGYFREAASIDLGDTMGNLAGGLHMATLGGLWQAVVFGFAGLSLSTGGLSLEPRIPRVWRSVSFPVCFRGSRVRVRIQRDPATLTAAVEVGAPVTVAVRGRACIVERGTEESWQLVDAEPVREALP